MKRAQRTVIAVIILPSFLLTLQMGCSRSNQVATFQRRITIDNPRKVGKHYFVSKSSDGKETGRSPEKSGGFQTELWEYWVDIGLLVRLRTGEVVAPEYMEKLPHFGSFGHLEYVNMPAKPQKEVSRAEQEITLPYTQEYATYIMLLRNLAEQTAERYLEIDAQQIHGSTDIIRVPDLKQLPLVRGRTDGAHLLRILSQAIEKYNEKIIADPSLPPGELVTGEEWDKKE